MAYLDSEVAPTDAQKEDPNYRAPAYTTISARVSGIRDLWYRQREIFGTNTAEDPRKYPGVRDFLAVWSHRQQNVDRSGYADRQRGTFMDGFSTTKEVQVVMDCYMPMENGKALRDRFYLAFTVFHLLRGDNIRSCELPDLFVLELEGEGYITCHALIMLTRQGKTNKDGRFIYLSFLIKYFQLISYVDLNMLLHCEIRTCLFVRMELLPFICFTSFMLITKSFQISVILLFGMI